MGDGAALDRRGVGAEQPTSPVTRSWVCTAILRVLGGFELVIGSRPVALGLSCQRLMTLLALNDGQIARGQAAGLLWPEVTNSRANANLRSVLWRLQRSCPEVLDASFQDLRLSAGVRVDLHEVTMIARRLLDRTSPLHPDELRQALQSNLYEDITPHLGDEEWLVVERERLHQLRLHAIEALCDQLIDAGWYGAAVDAALSVITDDPFRESAHRVLIKAYMAEGNHLDARRQYAGYRNMLRAELGLEPSDQLKRLVAIKPRSPSNWRSAPAEGHLPGSPPGTRQASATGGSRLASY